MTDSSELTEQQTFLLAVESAAHDLRTPLRHVRQGLDWLRHDDDRRDRQENLDFIDATTRQLERTIDGLLRLGSVLSRAVAKQAFRMDDALALTQDRLRVGGSAPSIVERVELDCRAAPTLYGDLELTVVSLEQLLRNADEYRHPDRESFARVITRIDHDEADNDPTFVVCVIDNGIGIDLTYGEMIFEPLRRLHRHAEHPGAGLGLTIARAAAHAQAGHLALDRSSEHGSSFVLRLPSV